MSVRIATKEGRIEAARTRIPTELQLFENDVELDDDMSHGSKAVTLQVL